MNNVIVDEIDAYSITDWVISGFVAGLLVGCFLAIFFLVSRLIAGDLLNGVSIIIAISLIFVGLFIALVITFGVATSFYVVNIAEKRLKAKNKKK